jgi:hypothetical protein
MSAIFKNIQEIKLLCDKNERIKIDRYYLDQLKIIFIINNKNIELYTEFNKYCYINEDNDFNYKMILIKKTPENIIRELNQLTKSSDFKSNDLVEIYDDRYNLNYKIILFSKNNIDFDKLYLLLIGKHSNFKLSQIPKNLLLSSKNICNIIINEIKKVNSNKDYTHFINIHNDDPFTIMIKIFFKNIEFDINFYLESYPYLPPNFNIITPIKNELYFALLNLNIFKIENWMSSITIEYLIINLYNILDPIIDNYIEKDIIIDNLEKNIMKLKFVFNFIASLLSSLILLDLTLY